MSPNTNGNVPRRDRKGYKDTGQTGHVRQEQMGVMRPQAEECRGPHKLEEARKGPSWNLRRRKDLADTLKPDSRPPELSENKLLWF